MTEEIIIDGVNVAGCKYYHYKGCTANNFGKCDSCSEIYKNCYFKQLQRLEQENELFRQAHKAEQDRRRKYENALEEIREIEQCMAVAKGVSENLVSAIDHVSNLLSEYENRRIKILTKINEVLGNESN